MMTTLLESAQYIRKNPLWSKIPLQKKFTTEQVPGVPRQIQVNQNP
jgi:hypothetical protein